MGLRAGSVGRRWARLSVFQPCAVSLVTRQGFQRQGVGGRTCWPPVGLGFFRFEGRQKGAGMTDSPLNGCLFF